MREIRSSGLEGGVEFKPPSLPLFYRNDDDPIILFVFGTGASRAARSSVRSAMSIAARWTMVCQAPSGAA
jgi:hypothetical protein